MEDNEDEGKDIKYCLLASLAEKYVFLVADF